MTVMLGHTNRIEQATLTSGSWVATLPITNLATRPIGQVARTTDATNASTKFDINLNATDRIIRIISLVNHNLSLDATYRVRGATDAAFTSVLIDTGTVAVWDAVYPPGTVEWEANNFWLMTPTVEDIEGFTTNLCVILASNTVARYWRVELFDTTNADGHVDIGRVFIGAAFIPANDAETGASIGWETPTTVTKTLSGAKYYQARTPYRCVSFSLNVMSVDEAMANVFEIDRISGIDKEIMYIFNSSDTFHKYRRSFLGCFRALSAIEYPYANITKKQFVIEESL